MVNQVRWPRRLVLLGMLSALLPAAGCGGLTSGGFLGECTGDCRLDIDYPPLAHISSWVFDEEGKPLEGALVRVMDGPFAGQECRAASHGLCVIGNLLTGGTSATFLVRATLKNYRGKEKSITTPGNGQVRVEFRLRRR